MANRCLSEFYSEQGDKYFLYIYDSDFSGVPFTFSTSNVILKWEGEGDERHSPIHSSTLTFDVQVEDSDFDDLIEDIVEAQEQRFFIELSKTGTANEIWRGLVLQDLVQVEDSYYPYTFQVIATDGIGTLKDVPYRDAAGTPFSGIDTIKDILIRLFGKIGANEMWGASEEYLKNITQWYESNMPISGANYDPLVYAKLNNEVFRDDENQPLDCYTVLEEIAKLFNARVYQSAGMYKFVQPDIFKSTDSPVTVSYQKDGTQHTLNNAETMAIVLDQSTNYRLTGMLDTYYPTLRKVKRKYSYKFAISDNYLVDETWLPTDTSFHVISDYTIYANMRLKFQALIETEFSNTSGSAISTEYYIKIPFQIKVGSYYWNNTSLLWTLTNTTNYFTHYIPDSTSLAEVVTTPVPVNGELSIKFYYDDTEWYGYNGTAIGSNPLLAYGLFVIRFNDVKCFPVSVSGDSIDNGFYVYEADNANSGEYTKLLDLGESLLGDGKYEFSLGAILIGASNAQSESWDIDNITVLGDKIHQLAVREILKGQSQPTKKLEINIFSTTIEIDDRVQLGSEYFIFNGGSYDLSNSILSSEYYYIVNHPGSVTDDELETPDYILTNPNFSAKSDSKSVITQEFNQITSLTAELSGADQTTIYIDALSDSILFSGEKMLIVNPVTLQNDEIELDADVEASDTEITIVAQTFNNPFPIGSIIRFSGYNNALRDIQMHLRADVVTKTSNYTADTETMIIIDASARAVTITLPSISGITGRKYEIKCIDATYAAKISADGVETIDGSTDDLELDLYDGIQLRCSISEWHII